MKIAVIGAGNGGQAIAGYLGKNGYTVSLYSRNIEKINKLKKLGGITLVGKVSSLGKVQCFTTDIAEAICGAEIVMITTIANAHKGIAKQIAAFAEDGQIFILNPGRTFGAIVFKHEIEEAGCTKHVYIAEAQTLVYACRMIEPGLVNIIGVKDRVLLSAIPASDTQHVLTAVNTIYPCFKAASHVLQTGLENIGAILHPCVMLFNAGTIERKSEFYFYRDITERIAAFIQNFDAERLNVGHAYNIDLLSVSEWIKFAYQNTIGDTLWERMQNNPGYYDIKSPSSLFIRQLTEDIPTGVLPIMELGKKAGLEMKLFESMINICESLLNLNFRVNGRTLKSLGLANMKKDEIIKYML